MLSKVRASTEVLGTNTVSLRLGICHKVELAEVCLEFVYGAKLPEDYGVFLALI